MQMRLPQSRNWRAAALMCNAQPKSRKDDPEARHKPGIDRMRAVIAERMA